MIFDNVEVAFAQVTGEGNENGKHLIGIFVDKKMLKALEKERVAVWDKGNTGTRKTPFQSLEDWCSEDEEDGRKFVWLSCDADPSNPSHALDYIVGEGDDFTMKDFAIIGAGSKVTVEFNMFMTKKNDKKKENVGRSMIAIQLHDLVPFEGGATPTTLKGKKLSGDGTSKKSKKADDSKSEKKKDKKKKKSKD